MNASCGVPRSPTTSVSPSLESCSVSGCVPIATTRAEHRLVAADVDDPDRVVVPDGHVGGLPVLRHQHLARADADRDLPEQPAGAGVELRERAAARLRRALVRRVEVLAVAGDPDGVRLRQGVAARDEVFDVLVPSACRRGRRRCGCTRPRRSAFRSGSPSGGAASTPHPSGSWRRRGSRRARSPTSGRRPRRTSRRTSEPCGTTTPIGVEPTGVQPSIVSGRGIEGGDGARAGRSLGHPDGAARTRNRVVARRDGRRCDRDGDEQQHGKQRKRAHGVPPLR